MFESRRGQLVFGCLASHSSRFALVKVNKKSTQYGQAKRQAKKTGDNAAPTREGKYKGRVGYYDDDADNINFAVVYFGTPFESKYVLIRRSWLKRTAVTPLALEKWKREHPELARYCGVP